MKLALALLQLVTAILLILVSVANYRLTEDLKDCRAARERAVAALQGSVRNTANALRSWENAQDLLTAERADRDQERRLSGRVLAGSKAEWEARR